MSNDKPVSVILNAAADDLEINGWGGEETGMKVAGPHCALGAIAHVTPDARVVYNEYGYSIATSPAVNELVDYLGRTGESDPSIAVFKWNDAEGRTADEVIAALRAAAVIAASRETEPTTQPSGEAVASHG